MGRLIDKYIFMDPDFKFEFNSYLQELKSQNELEKMVCMKPLIP